MTGRGRTMSRMARLLLRGLSQATIARRLDVSPQAVQRCAARLRRLAGEKLAAEDAKSPEAAAGTGDTVLQERAGCCTAGQYLRHADTAEAPCDDEWWADLEGIEQARRCEGCGGLVYVWPCLKCEIRAQRRAASTSTASLSTSRSTSTSTASV